MKIHEFQAKDVFSSYGIPVQKGKAISNPDEAKEAAKEVSPEGPWVVKAQIHAGGRGKGLLLEEGMRGEWKKEDDGSSTPLVFRGDDSVDPSSLKRGVQFAKTLDEVESIVSSMLGKRLWTKQTSLEGQKVQKVLICEALDIGREIYLGMVLDREKGLPVIMASAEGGMEIEEIARTNPEAILKVHFHHDLSVWPYQARLLAFFLGLEKDQLQDCQKMVLGLAKAFVELDASLVEINPLVVTKDGKLVALDAKMSFEDNALFRHPDIQKLRDIAEEDPTEYEATSHGLSYVKLDGNIGCMVNGAGLAMATMDIIKYYGGSPANFLDVGGGARRDQIQKAFEILLGDPNVKAVLVNIFGGIMKCDVIANGILDALKTFELKVPLVVRLEGTNVEEGKKILRESGLPIIEASDMADGAQKVVEAASKSA
ncbi:MAG: ADP-forming succinate--CoA ligase subunit beta [Planctomycetota bacterium]|nr:MAG: ADP-forming succinate--CoA ligase subunit beta [Planctomycetota bacterium]